MEALMKTMMHRSCAALMVVGVFALLPAGCGQKKEDSPAPKPDMSTPKLPTAPPNTLPPVNPPADPLAAAKQQSQHNLKRIAVALHTHHDARKSLPAGLMNHATFKAGLSWRVQILPYLDDPAAPDLY